MTIGTYRSQRGMSYPEVVAAVLLLSIMLVPTMDALRAALRGSDIQVKNTIDHYLLIAKMEAVNPGVSLDLLITSMLVLGATRRVVANVISQKSSSELVVILQARKSAPYYPATTCAALQVSAPTHHYPRSCV